MPPHSNNQSCPVSAVSWERDRLGRRVTSELISRALKSQYFVYFQLNHAASRLVRNELCAFIELIFSENKHFE